MVICGKYILNADETKGTLEDLAFLDEIAIKANQADLDKGVGSQKTEGTVKARMYFADGTDAEVKLSKYDGDKLTQAIANSKLVSNNQSKSGLVTYTKLSDGTYDIEFVYYTNSTDKNIAGCDALKIGSGKVDEKIDSMPINDDAVIFVKARTEIKVLSGKSVANWSAKNNVGYTVLTNAKNGLDYVAAGLLTVSDNTVPGATADTKYGYLTRDGYTVTVDGEKKAAYEVWTTEGTKTLIEDSSAPKAGTVTGKVISYTLDGNYIDDVTVVGADAAIIGSDRKVKGTAKVAMDSTAAKTYSFDEDCVFVAIDDSKTDGAEGGIEAIPEAQKCGSNTYMANAIVVLKNDGTEDKIVAVFYDVDNMLDRNTVVNEVLGSSTLDNHQHFVG